VLDGYSDLICNAQQVVQYREVEQSANIIGLDTRFKATQEDEEFLMQYADEADVIVATNYYWRLCPANNSDLIKKLIAKGKKVVVVTNCPYELGAVPQAGTVICNYSVTPESLRVAAEIIYGKTQPQGKWMLRYYAQPVASRPDVVVTLKGGITRPATTKLLRWFFNRCWFLNLSLDAYDESKLIQDTTRRRAGV
jgi:hypothetical protein